MAITFDPVNYRIILDSSNITTTEIYSRWVDWAAVADNIKYGMVIRQVGSDDLGGGLSIPPYYFLQGSWRIRPMEADHNLTITGNIFVEGGGVPVVSTIGQYQVNVNYTVPVQAQGISTAGSDPASIAAAVRSELTLELAQLMSLPSAENNAASVWSYIIEGSNTTTHYIRRIAALLYGKVSGAGTGTEVFRNPQDTKNRVSVTVDNNGNRLGVEYDDT